MRISIRYGAQRIFFVADPKHGVHRWNDGALRAGFAPELLRQVPVGTLVNNADRQVGMIFPAVYVGAHPVVIDVGIAEFGHAQERGAHAGQRAMDNLKMSRQQIGVIGGRCIETGMESSHARTGFLFDLNVNQDEPFLIDAAKKVLNQSDIAALDFARRIEAEEVM